MQDVEKIAKSIVKLNIKNKDALHIASTIFSSCEYFITTDDIILKRFKGGKIFEGKQMECIKDKYIYKGKDISFLVIKKIEQVVFLSLKKRTRLLKRHIQIF
jgi:hypothetical protein